MGLGLGLGIQFNSLGGMASKILTWGKSIPARFWGTETPEYWGGLDTQAEAHYNRVIADGGVVPAGLGGVNSFFQVVKGVYGTSDINTAISAAYDPHYLGYKLGAGSGTTLGQAAQKLYSCSGASADVVQTTAASQPLLLAHEGANYWWGSGVTGNHCSTPNAPANQITGDIEIIAKIDYKNSGTQCITSKNIGVGSGQLAWTLFINSSNLLNLEIFSSAYTFATSSVSIGATFNGFIKVTRIASTGSVQFFTSTDGITYNQLGTTQSTTIGSLTNVNTPLNIGSYQSTNVFPFQGRIFRVTIANSIGGTPVVDFNPSSYNPSTSQTQWTSATGEVWTINTGTATTGYKGVLVNRSIVQGDGVDDAMQTTNSIWGSTTTIYSSIKFYNLNSRFGTTLDSDTGNSAVQKYEGIDSVNNYFVYQGGLSFNRNVSTSNNLLRLYNSVRNGAFSALNVNNDIDTTGTLNSVATTGIRILNNRALSPTYYTNGDLTSIIISSNANNSTQRTAMYNYLRSLNNNAF